MGLCIEEKLQPFRLREFPATVDATASRQGAPLALTFQQPPADSQTHALKCRHNDDNSAAPLLIVPDTIRARRILQK